MAHTYSKFKNKNIPYAKVGRRVFNSLFDAETFCTEHSLDVNSAIEYRDDPELKNNIQTIAQYQKAILQECLDRLKARAEALVEVSKHCEEGALKYGERNCEKGIPIHSLIDSAFRHLAKYMMGMDDEPHLRAACWNCLFALYMEIKHPELQDIPTRMKEGQ